MRRHVEVHQKPKRDKYRTYWRLQLLMLLNTIKKIFSQKNINTNNTSDVGQMIKIALKKNWSFSLGTLLFKYHCPMHVLEEITRNIVTS